MAEIWAALTGETAQKAPLAVARLGGYFEHPLHVDVAAAFEQACDILGVGRRLEFGLAEAARALEQLNGLFRKADLLLAPATPCPAFPLGVTDWQVSGEILPIRLGIGKFTQCLTPTHVPVAVASVMGATSGLPVGVQLIAAAGREDRLLAGLAQLDRAGFRIAMNEVQP
jgi:Asp-tRNA(Asn)/Glu-tRNA(Gln) amidotransferase A subunit family amidase